MDNDVPYLSFSGGEPMLHPQFFEMVERVTSRGAELKIETNGHYLTRDNCARLKDLEVKAVQVSLDGATAASFNRMRVRGEFDRAVEGLRNLRDAGVPVEINFSPAKFNMSEIGAVVDLAYELGAEPPAPRTVTIPAGVATLGARREGITFGWDNEFAELQVDVPEFEVDVHSITNADFLEFIDEGGYHARELWTEEGWDWREKEQIEFPVFWSRPEAGRTGRAGWRWRGMFEFIPLPPAWPAYVSHAEAAAYARWKGRRLPTEAEYHRAAFGTPSGEERQFPWGSEPADPSRGNFDFTSWEAVPAGSRPAGASAWGVHDLVGNGWEWTSTVFGPLPGFAPMSSYPEYSADFFDGQHYVMKGASPATARELVRRSFRNWFRPNYPYVYAKFRTAAG